MWYLQKLSKNLEKEKRKIINGILANVAPTILEIMGIEKPNEMDQKSLLSNWVLLILKTWKLNCFLFFFAKSLK